MDTFDYPWRLTDQIAISKERIGKAIAAAAAAEKA